MDDLDPEELVHWMAFWKVEPWGQQRADLRAGIIAQTVANVNRPRGKPAFRAEQFMAYVPKEQKQRSTAARLRAALSPRVSK